MKKIIYFLGISFLILIVILNLIFTANLNTEECIKIDYNSFIYISGIIIMGIIIYYFSIFLNKYLYNNEEKARIRKKLLIFAMVIYILFNIIWALLVNPKVVGDSVHVCNLAQTFYRENTEDFLNNSTYIGVTLKQYMQAYPQQISLAFVFSTFFRIIHFDKMEVLRVLNITGNILIVIALYKINKQLSKKYKSNKTLLFILILTFISLPMLVTFIYGDILSIALCLFSVYFIMKYTENKKTKYYILALLLTMIAYMMRMNTLIFIIATVIYLLLNFFKEIRKNGLKEKLLSISLIIVYVGISIIPANLVKNYYFNKYDLDKNKIYPNISYILMAMEESPRGNGWYNENISKPAILNPEEIEYQYREEVKKRLKYFAENIDYAFNFYILKIASMWTENTYSAVSNNQIKDDVLIQKSSNIITFYQKILLIITCLCCIVFLIKNRKNISLEVIFLLTIFVGGFTFHILWEAKSRYIIPYILILIPIASLNIDQLDIKKIMKHIKRNRFKNNWFYKR